MRTQLQGSSRTRLDSLGSILFPSHRLRPQRRRRRRRLGPGQRPGLPERLLPLHRRGERANEVAGGDTASILPAMRNIDAALGAAVKASTAVQSGVTQGFPP